FPSAASCLWGCKSVHVHRKHIFLPCPAAAVVHFPCFVYISIVQEQDLKHVTTRSSFGQFRTCKKILPLTTFYMEKECSGKKILLWKLNGYF
ncbi:hypothetical protein T310_6177, partial [Rasamsonia emersonii CBS 393.64]